MKKIFITLSVILTAVAATIISAEPEVTIIDSQFQEDKVAIDTEDSKLETKRIIFPYPLLQSTSTDVTEACTLCEYLLLVFIYIQDATHPITEEKVKECLDKVCTRIPSSMEGKCQEFVDTYGEAIATVLIQEIDPSLVCPIIRICRSDELLDMWENIPKHFFTTKENKPDCPFCLFAVTQIYDVIKDNKIEASVEAEFDKLCKQMPNRLTDVCIDFVESHSEELIELLLAGSSPEELCNYIHLCQPTDDSY